MLMACLVVPIKYRQGTNLTYFKLNLPSSVMSFSFRRTNVFRSSGICPCVCVYVYYLLAFLIFFLISVARLVPIW